MNLVSHKARRARWEAFNGTVSREFRVVNVRKRSMSLVEAHLLRQATKEFRATCATRPFTNHASLAINCFARAVHLQPKDMSARGRQEPMVELRQQCMTFVHLMVPEIGLAGTARLFRRRINTVRAAVKKYREPMVRAIRQAS